MADGAFIEKPASHVNQDVASQRSTSTDKSHKSSERAAFNPGWRFKVAFSSLSIITLMVALDATSISVALPVIAKTLHGSAIEAFWTGTSFLLTSTVWQPVVANFSHIFGRKPLVMVCLALFGVGAIIAATANDFTVILIGRSIQGTGGGGIIALTEIIATDLVPLRERGKWFAFISSMWALGTVIGPILGGGFAQSGQWPWIFWINLPFIGVGVVMIVVFLTINSDYSEFMAKLKRVDWIGTVVFIAASTGFLVPISWGGVQYPWDSWRTLAPLIVCAAALVVFVWYEEYLARRGFEPTIRLNVLKQRTAAITYFTAFIHGMILWCILYYLPLYYEAVKGYSPIVSAIALFPETFTVAPASIVAGVTIAKTGKYRMFTWAGWAVATLGLGLLMLLEVDTSIPSWIFLNIVVGLGTGVLFSAMAIAVQAASTNENMDYAVALFSFFRILGQTIGVAIGGVLFQNEMRKNVLHYPSIAAHATQYAHDASALVQIIKSMPEGVAKADLKLAYVASLKPLFIFLTVLSGVAFLVSLGIEALNLNRMLQTKQGYKHKGKTKDNEIGGTQAL